MVRLTMMKLRRAVLASAGIAGLTLLGGCACQNCATSEPAVTPEAAQAEPIEVHQWDRWRIAGQPAPDDYERQAKAGTALVVNLRTQPELDRLDFDPRAEVEARGMRYAWIPMGGDEGYDTEQVAAFTRAIEGIDGPIMIHCASGGRARHLWAAYLVEEQSVPLDEAMLRMEEVGGQPTLMERFLGHRLHYTIGAPLPPAEDDAGS
jgi:uncharacterized protein (TIGR01244 family)